MSKSGLQEGKLSVSGTFLLRRSQFTVSYRKTTMLGYASLPLDDPDRVINPDQNRQYWSDADGNRVENDLDGTHYTLRTCLVTDVSWGEAEQTFVLSISMIQN